MVTRFLSLAAALVLLATGLSSAQAAPVVLAIPTAHQLTGTFGGFTSNPWTSMTITTPHHGVVAVSFASTVRVVRRYNGASSLSELNLNDRLALRGSFTGATTFVATSIKDITIQEAATRAMVRITTSATATSFAGTIHRDVTSSRAPFDEGAKVTVMVGASTKILMWSTALHKEVVGATTSLTAGTTVTVRGVYDRKTKTFTVTDLIRLHS